MGDGDDEALRRLTLELDYPVQIVTAHDGDEASGCLVGFASQASIDPVRYAVWLSHANRTYAVARRAAVLVVHPLDRRERHLAELFGGETGDEVDKLARCRWHPGPDGRTPVIEGVRRWFAGRILEVRDDGDHSCFLLEPFQAEADPGGWDQLGFQAARSIEPGHPPGDPQR